jgi:serine/threonine protein kinase
MPVSCHRCDAELLFASVPCPECGREGSVRLETAEHSPLHTQLLRRLRAATSGEFEIVRHLGHGGMARVYLAHELALNRHVALKVLSPLFGEYPEIIRRFQQEARTAAQLNHPHVVPVFTVYQGNGLCFFTMPYIEGSSLRRVLDGAERFDVPTALDYVRQAASALAYAHEHGVVHRDIKPENILIESSTARLVITDFGLAKALGSESVTIPGDLIGTPHYMAPEQCEAQSVVDARSDQYSLALVAYEMFSGSYPFSGLGLRELLVRRLSSDPPPLRSIRADVPSHVSAAIQRALSRNPEERFPSIEAFLRSVTGSRSGVVTSEGFGAVRALAASFGSRITAANPLSLRRPAKESLTPRLAGGWKVWAARTAVVAAAAMTCFLAMATMSGSSDVGEVNASIPSAPPTESPFSFIDVPAVENVVDLFGPPRPAEETSPTAASSLQGGPDDSARAGDAGIEPTIARGSRRDRHPSTNKGPRAERGRPTSRRMPRAPAIVPDAAVPAGTARAPEGSAATSAESAITDEEPVAVANAVPAPQALFESYRRALELENMAGVRALYAGALPGAEENFLAKMFERGEEIRAEVKLVDLKLEGRHATADVDFPLTYVLSRTKWSQQHTLKLRLDLVAEPGGWLIQDSRRR